MFEKHNSTVSDYFVAIKGKWIHSSKNYLIISIYVSQELYDKKVLWDYLHFIIDNWAGEVVIIGDFNEVRTQDERFGSIFNIQGAAIFNSFISSSGLVDVPMGGCSFTWVHKFAAKMSKLDRFLISEGLMESCPNISAITLDRYLSDHRPILLRELCFDYGPTPFRFYHYWFELEGFDKFVEQVWNDYQSDDFNAMLRFMNKLKYLKTKLRLWTKTKKESLTYHNTKLKSMLIDIDKTIDAGYANSDLLNNRKNMITSLLDMEKLKSLEVAQKAKIKWSIEGDESSKFFHGDENSKFFHGILNKKRINLAIRGILVDCVWIDSPPMVKDKFLSHFKNRFDCPSSTRLSFDMNFPNQISSEVQVDLKKDVSLEELKRAVWDCGMDKSPRPDGFTFGFIGDIGVCMFKGVSIGSNLHLSHLFYADDVVFWSNGIAVDDDIVNQAVHSIGCLQLKPPFSYLGSRIGGGRPTLLKSLLGSIPIYYMSLFKVPSQ
nr:RNA-directed DNA polymerase, eukaryota [Tanacetum cinerariifolium]